MFNLKKTFSVFGGLIFVAVALLLVSQVNSLGQTVDDLKTKGQEVLNNVNSGFGLFPWVSNLFTPNTVGGGGQSGGYGTSGGY